MLFNTPQFLVFYFIVLVLYWIFPHKIRKVWLLVSSYYFYMNWNATYGLLLLGVTVITYFVGLYLGKTKDSNSIKIRKLILGSTLIFCLLILAVYKYSTFCLDIVSGIIQIFGNSPLRWEMKLILPVGISFYTLQSLGYLIDVYRGDIYPEHNFLTYALFISFFPQLVAGPIERSKNLLRQLTSEKRFSYDNLRYGFVMVLWGLFMKMVIADRAATIVDTVYGSIENYDGIHIIIATILFSIQIYCDFCGYSTIAIGVARTMGFNLIENFKAPFFSKSVKEFWSRWHISLSNWFRDYLYIPLGGNKKGITRKRANLLIVFAVSGLWHGASFAYIIWGLLNGLYQVVAELLLPVRKRLGALLSWRDNFANKCLSTLGTFILFSTSMSFFRAGNMEAVARLFSQIIKRGVHLTALFSLSTYELGLERGYVNILFIALILLGIVDYCKYKGRDVLNEFIEQQWWARTLIELILIFAIIVFGRYGDIYDTASFIYFQF